MLRLCCGWFGLFAVFSALSAEDPRPNEKMSYVEFDFAPLPRTGMGGYDIHFTLLTSDKDIKVAEGTKFFRETDASTNCEFLASYLKNNGFKIDVVDKTKLRVYGYVLNGKLIPATKGIVKSKDLKPEELPKVKNPPQA